MHHFPYPLLLCLLLGAATPGRAAEPQKPRALKRPELLQELKKLVVAPALRRAIIGVAVYDLADRQWLFDHNADQLLIVASNNKLATTAAALELLGPDFQFTTTVAAIGETSADGVLAGDLLLKGRGDPSISGRFHDGKATAVIDEWAKAVAAAGIKSVRGAILADDLYFDRQATHPLWPKAQQSAWYCAPTGALSFNDNCIRVVVKPGPRRDALAVITTEPPTAYVTIVNQCTTSRARLGDSRILVHRRENTNQIIVSGRIREKSAPCQTWITIDGPALYAATVFREALAARKIPVGGPVRLRTIHDRFDPEACRELITTTSALKDALAVANSNSQNFYAEQILKTLGREKADQGTWAAGAKVVAEFLRTAGVAGGFEYHDGSGLARANRFSARQIAQLLAYMNTRRNGSAYLHSLAEPGEPGTLARRLDPLRERVFAKTGYIAGVSALSGYVETRDGRMLAFSILVNDFRCALAEVRQIQDAICLFLGDYAP